MLSFYQILFNFRVHFGVPVICIPINFDQPGNARRVSDELCLGKQFDPMNLNAGEISNAIGELLDDETYLERMVLMAKLSRRHNGNINGCQEILKALEKKTN